MLGWMIWTSAFYVLLKVSESLLFLYLMVSIFTQGQLFSEAMCKYQNLDALSNSSQTLFLLTCKMLYLNKGLFVFNILHRLPDPTCSNLLTTSQTYFNLLQLANCWLNLL